MTYTKKTTRKLRSHKYGVIFIQMVYEKTKISHNVKISVFDKNKHPLNLSYSECFLLGKRLGYSKSVWTYLLGNYNSFGVSKPI